MNILICLIIIVITGITDETLSTAANFDRYGHPHDVYRL